MKMCTSPDHVDLVFDDHYTSVCPACEVIKERDELKVEVDDLKRELQDRPAECSLSLKEIIRLSLTPEKGMM